MEKRAVAAIGISFLILLAWSYLVPQPEQPPPAAEPTAVEQTADDSATSPVPPAESPAEDATAAAEPPDVSFEPLVGDAEQTIEVQTEHADVVLTNRGGRVVDWRLRDYPDKEGRPLDVFPAFEGDGALPFGLALDDRTLAADVNAALFAVQRSTVSDAARGTGHRVAFTWADGTGRRVEKTFVFYERDWLVDVELRASDRGRAMPAGLVVGPGFAVQEPREGKSTYYYAGQGVWNVGGQVERKKAKKLVDEAGSRVGSVRWAGLEDQYFTALVLPDSGPGEVSWFHETLTPVAESWDDPETAPEPAEQPLVAVALPEGSGRLYVGPKRYTMLRDLGNDLDAVVWFSSNGLLYAISKSIFLGLLWIYDRIAANYGIAIVLATIALRLLLFPVNQYSMVSIKKTQLQMQKLQPKLKAIKNKYKKSKDPQSRVKMNEETMKLYKAEGVNPAGGLAGCLPLLAQFPILIGFYNMLTVAVELRGAPFGLWITDLSQKDPYWVMPILMGVTMFAQQKLAMSKVTDPMQQQQQKIMMIMPFVFTWICLQMPAGLVLYWFVNNLLGIGQQWLVNRTTGRLEAAEARKA